MTADNQQGSPDTWGNILDPSETTRRAPLLRSYLLAAIRDGTYNKKHRTWRISQKSVIWLNRLKKLLNFLGFRSWIYREGKTRNVWVLETTAKFLRSDFDPMTLKTRQEKIAYVQGYFDAEGGIPHSKKSPFYIQLVQKNLEDLKRVKLILEELGIQCGKIHNPSKRIDPHYWRFFISRSSLLKFVKIVSSWHPIKQALLRERMKI